MKNKNLIKQKFELEIIVDKEEVMKKYPNYSFNFNSIEEFTNFIVSNLKMGGGINLETKGMVQFGYAIKINSQKISTKK